LLTAAALISAGLPGCRREKAGESSSAAPPRGMPPLDKFEVELELPTPPGKPAPVPPEAALAPFRVWVNQETPRQKKNPEWRSIPAKEGLILDMATDGRWSCLVNPVRLFAKFDDEAEVMHWTTSRTLRCSSDQWKTNVEGLVRVGYAPDGKRLESDPRAAFHLKDFVAGQPRVTAVVLEPAVT
jgi:hypothetical protein